MRHAPGERPAVSPQQTVEKLLEGHEQATVLLRLRVLEVAAAEHRRQGQRNETRNENGGADGDGEFVQQAADDAAHEKYGDEYRDQRERHGNDGEAYFPRAADRGGHRLFAVLDVADDVLQHHDRVIDDEAYRERERQQREVVEAVAERLHDGEGADHGDGQRQRGNDRGRQVAQEHQDHQDHQEAGEDQGELHVGD
jgi:hypothetical protein